MAANHFTLHGKHTHGEVKIPLTRLEALKFFKKWSRSAQRRSRKGRRILFLMDIHRGFAVDQLVIETVHEKLRQHRATRWQAPTTR
jgi:hypothetical protein